MLVIFNALKYWSKIDNIKPHYMPILSSRSKIVNIDSFRGFYDVTISQIWGVYKIMDISIEFLFLERSFYRNFAIFTHLVNKLVFLQCKVILHLWIFSKISRRHYAQIMKKTPKKWICSLNLFPWITLYTDFRHFYCFGIIKSNLVVKGSVFPVLQLFCR